MIFDQFARMIERYRPERVELIEQARLFELPYVPHEILPKGNPGPEALADFVLPFPEVAVEDRTSCTFLFDTQPAQAGFGTRRGFIDVQRTGTGREAYAALDPTFEHLAGGEEEFFIANFGTIDRIVTEGSQFAVLGRCEFQVAFNRDRLLDVTLREELQPLGREVMDRFDAVMRNAVTALEELMLISADHETFVLESTPLRSRPAKPGRITRSHDRPVYTLLRPEQIRSRLGLPGPGTGEGRKSPHERRRHWRHLQSPFYTHKQGEKVLVPACWIGPSERVLQKRRYKVRLDL